MELETVSYQQVCDGYKPDGDEYGLAEYALAPPRKQAFLANPNLNDYSKVMLKLLRKDGKIIGRSMMFPSRFKADEQIIETVGGSALEVAKPFRDGEAGGFLMSYNIRHKENNAIISSGFSETAAKCHKALRAYLLCFPLYIQIRDFRPILTKIGFHGILANFIGTICNYLYSPVLLYIKNKTTKKYKQYKIEQVTEIPQWVEEIVLHDGHKYMEIHDQKWLQWSLNNMFHSHKNNINRFYIVKIGVENVGFFMIKERVRVIAGKESLLGTICEWGTKDSHRLSEYDLNLLALNKFSNNVDAIFYATNDTYTEQKMKKMFFFRKGEAQIAFYDLHKKFREARSIDLWRVRLGYADTILN